MHDWSNISSVLEVPSALAQSKWFACFESGLFALSCVLTSAPFAACEPFV